MTLVEWVFKRIRCNSSRCRYLSVQTPTQKGFKLKEEIIQWQLNYFTKKTQI
ncbi:MAG: hypothetical protein JWM44_2342 [Bacilli bacterium]|nr:hypothetical protein [Bacilli bacterium]